MMGIHEKRFVFVAYGTVYGYVGITYQLMRDIHDYTAVLTYLVITGTIVMLSMVTIARRFGRQE